MHFYNKFKKYFFFTFILIAILIIAYRPVFCADYLTTKLNEIEKSYYGYTTSGTIETRLSKLEKAIYGIPSQKPQKNRIEKLYNDLNITTSTGAAAPVNQTAAKSDIGPKAEAGIKYPVVDKMEQKVFKKAYINDDIYVRLSRLEKQTFKKESTLSLNERVDALRSKILGGSQNEFTNTEIDPVKEEIVLENGEKYYGDYTNNNFKKYEYKDNSNYNYYSYENSKTRIPEAQSHYNDKFSSDGRAYAEKYAQSYDLDILEKNILGKRYTSDAPSKRLARLESKVFERTFSDSEEARIQRLLAVTTAQKTSQEYDSNKWARRINAGMQIGSILLMVLAMIL